MPDVGMTKIQKNRDLAEKKMEKPMKKSFFHKSPQIASICQKSRKIEIWTDFGRFRAIFRPIFWGPKYPQTEWTITIIGGFGNFGEKNFFF